MNSKERGLAPFKSKIIDRLPMWYGGAPETTKNIVAFLDAKNENEALYDILGIDYKTIRPKYIGKPFVTFEDNTFLNEWGIKRAGYHYGQALNHPLSYASSVKEVEDYNWPNPNEWDVKITNEQLIDVNDYCLIGATWAPFFHDATELVGMEKFFYDMYDQPEVVECIIERCFDFYYELNKRTFEANKGKIDFYFMGNDFGTQRSLILSPDTWRRFFKPSLVKFVDLAHKNGAVAGLHSCGDIHEIIPDLIEIGFDVVNPIQVNADNMNPVDLKQKYGKEIVLFGAIDENEILLNQSPQRVREETKRMIDALGKDGRYIVAASHDYLLPEVPAENIVAMYDEARKYFGY